MNISIFELSKANNDKYVVLHSLFSIREIYYEKSCIFLLPSHQNLDLFYCIFYVSAIVIRICYFSPIIHGIDYYMQISMCDGQQLYQKYCTN